MTFLDSDLLYTLSIVSHVFTCSISETGFISVIRRKEGNFPSVPIKTSPFLHQTISMMSYLKNVNMISGVQNKSCLFLFDNW